MRTLRMTTLSRHSTRATVLHLIAAVLLVPACAAPPPAAGGPEVGGVQQDREPGEILWDEWGVPYIYARTDSELFRGVGWSQAQAHGAYMLEVYGEVRGRAAEYWGEDYVEGDRLVRTLGLPARAAEWLRDQPGRIRPLLEAYVDGINAYFTSYPESVPAERRRVLPVTEADVMGWALWLLQYGYVSDARGSLRRAERLLDQGEAEARTETPANGSNAWAIGPGRSATGNAILVGNPHVPLDGAFYFFEVHLERPGLAAQGATVAGLPTPIIGFNGRLGWTLTVNPRGIETLYLLEREGESYRFGDGLRPFEIRQEEIRVRQADGSVRADTLAVRESIHGPVLAADEDGAVAFRVPGLEESGLLDQLWGMMTAGTLDEFETETARLQLPMFNIMYADADGRILYLYNGLIPVRDPGASEAAPGVLRGSEPSALWTDYLAYEDLPRLADPETGWLQNANNPPWWSTYPRVLEPADYPSYLPQPGLGPRAQRSIELIRADTSITFDEIVRYKHSTDILLADRLLDDLLPLAATTADDQARRAGEALAAWNRRTDAESRGGTLFLTWAGLWLEDGDEAFSEPWDPDRPLDTPDGIADPDAAVAALAAAADSMVARHGSLTAPWGEVHHLRFGGTDYPANGGPGGAGIFRALWFNEENRAVHGESYVAVVEFTPEGPRARSLLTYGNWSREGSRHVGDQTRLFVRKELRPVPWTREEVEAQVIRREPVPEPADQVGGR